MVAVTMKLTEPKGPKLTNKKTVESMPAAIKKTIAPVAHHQESARVARPLKSAFLSQNFVTVYWIRTTAP